MLPEININVYLANRRENDLLIDAREEQLYLRGTISGAINISLDNIRQLYELPKDQNIYVFCQTGDLSREIVELLRDAGYSAYNLSGGYREYLRLRLEGLTAPSVSDNLPH